MQGVLFCPCGLSSGMYSWPIIETIILFIDTFSGKTRKQIMTSHLEQQLASLQLNHGDIQANRKVGPAVPPKPKKPQPQVCH